MKVTDMFKCEVMNTDKIVLYPSGKFYVAYDMSVFLLVTYLWTDIKILHKTDKNKAHHVRIGFPASSLQDRILVPATEQGLSIEQVPQKEWMSIAGYVPKAKLYGDVPQVELPDEKESDLPVVVIGPCKVDQEAYKNWYNAYMSNIAALKAKMVPFYGESLLYKDTFDYACNLANVVEHIKGGIQTTVGTRLIDNIINNSYSCRVGKGTLYGIQQVEKFLRAATNNYRREAWVMKCDISGYFRLFPAYPPLTSAGIYVWDAA